MQRSLFIFVIALIMLIAAAVINPYISRLQSVQNKNEVINDIHLKSAQRDAQFDELFNQIKNQFKNRTQEHNNIMAEISELKAMIANESK